MPAEPEFMPAEQSRGAQAFEVSFDGTPLPGRRGQTIAAVLTAAGIRFWRTTRHGGRPRGLFCGIGVCFDCLVTVNGTPNVRACVTTALPGDVIVTQEGTGHAG
jgi:predicted molibdopterin-dependent oxidoreductase YjgC